MSCTSIWPSSSQPFQFVVHWTISLPMSRYHRSCISAHRHHTPSLSLLVGLLLKWGRERVHETSSKHFESLPSQLLSHLLWQLTYLQGSRTYPQLSNFLPWSFEAFCNSTGTGRSVELCPSISCRWMSNLLPTGYKRFQYICSGPSSYSCCILLSLLRHLHNKLHKGILPFSLSHLHQQKIPWPWTFQHSLAN